MKKTVCSVLLCLALSLLCGTALADDLAVEVHPLDEETVQIVETDKGGDPAFTVTRSSGAEAGQLYLALIMTGSDPAAKPVPTKDNVYYLDVAAADGSSISFEAYPRDLDAGTYVVYLSDWSAGNDGKALGVGTITVSGSAGGSAGDLDGNGVRDIDDIMALIKAVANKETVASVGASADVDGSGGVDIDDIMALIKMVANKE